VQWALADDAWSQGFVAVEEVPSTVRGRDSVVELISAMTDALARSDEGDMDCPAWENTVRTARLRAQLRLLSRRTSDPVTPPPVAVSGSRLEGIVAS
jgi:hypothetical protein